MSLLGEELMVQTERGIVCINARFGSGAEAEKNGYYYSFTSKTLNRDLYSKVLDDKGHYRVFATIEKE